MKLIQISDLHITDKSDLNQYESMIKKMTERIGDILGNDEKVYFVCCGDIVDKGCADGYLEKAKSLFDYFVGKMSTFNVEFVFVPGNHDLCKSDFCAFQNFVSIYNTEIDFSSKSVITLFRPNCNIVLINTSHHKDWKYGSIDISELERALSTPDSKPSIVVMHHTLMSRYSNDRSAIDDAYAFLDLLDKNRVICVLHGHTHGYSNITVGNGCQIIGVGSLFEYMPSCNFQFSVIDVQAEKVNSVTNYRYLSDLERFQTGVLYENKRSNFFEGETISSVYGVVRDAVKNRGGINNLLVNLESEINSYFSDMTQNFPKDIELAKLWLEEKVPDSIYYNHGSYMVESDTKGIRYIIDELKRNSTSNRAIIPLIRFADVLEKRGSYLPGLNSIQFGFVNDSKEELYCSVYLRSLEVNHFLKINLAELYLMILEIKQAIRSLVKVRINLYAFKAQYKENFSCFKKARIDTLDSGDLSHLLYNRRLREIYELLKEKFDMEETIVNTRGLAEFCNILEKSQLYEEEYGRRLKEIISDLETLREENMKNSDYATIRPMEDKIHEKQARFLTVVYNDALIQVK